MKDPNLIYPGKDPDFVFPEEGASVMGLPPQFVYDENVRLHAEIERLRAFSIKATEQINELRQERERLQTEIERLTSRDKP